MAARLHDVIAAKKYRVMTPVIALFFTTIVYRAASAESIAASLAEYRKVTCVPTVSGITGTSFSGVALNREAGKLYVVDNGNADIYELSLSGEVERTIPTRNIFDPEGICHLSDTSYFIAEEGTGKVLRVEIPVSGTGPVSAFSVPSIQIGINWANNGVEGVSYCTTDNMLYVVKETNPSELFRVTLDDQQGFMESYPDDPFDISNRNGDAADIAALNDGNFIIVNQEENRLEGFDSTGAPLSTFDLDMTKPEGITIDTTDGTIYMVGEPREFCVLKPATVHLGNTPVERPDFSLSISATGITGQPFEISLSLPTRSPVAIDGFAVNGRHCDIWHSTMEAGRHRLKPMMTHLPTGIYLFRITVGHRQKNVIFPLW